MKIGDYVRTKDDLGIQLICKINKIIDEYCINTDKGYWDTEHIIKSSPNIIDLIQVGDYVNGCPVLHKENNELVCGLLLRYKEENIQNVVTKEQFSQMKYEVGD